MKKKSIKPGWTERLALVATSYRRVGLGRLGQFVLGPDDLAGREALKQAFGAEELVYLATCNRVECYLLMPHPLSPGDEEELASRAGAFFSTLGAETHDAFLIKRGQQVVDHVFSVVSSLDSLVVGETQISGQARRAEEHCCQIGVSGPVLGHLFERSVAASRRVRAETQLGNTLVSAASIAVSKIKKYFGAEGPKVSVLVGVGEMTCKVAQALKDKPGEVIFVNRTVCKAAELAERFGGRALSLAEFLLNPPEWIDLLFAATGATEAVVPPSAVAPALAARKKAGARGPMVVCDLGLPRDVDPALDDLPGVLVVDMELVQRLVEENRDLLREEVVLARQILRKEITLLARTDRFEALADLSAEQLLDDRLAHLPADERQVIQRFAIGLAARFARQPQSRAWGE